MQHFLLLKINFFYKSSFFVRIDKMSRNNKSNPHNWSINQIFFPKFWIQLPNIVQQCTNTFKNGFKMLVKFGVLPTCRSLCIVENWPNRSLTSGFSLMSKVIRNVLGPMYPNMFLCEPVKDSLILCLNIYICYFYLCSYVLTIKWIG